MELKSSVIESGRRSGIEECDLEGSDEIEEAKTKRNGGVNPRPLSPQRNVKFELESAYASKIQFRFKDRCTPRILVE